MAEIKKIPDYSEHQGKIDWSKASGKIPGAIIRIGYGDNLRDQDDVYAAYNLRECERLGIPYAVYLYSYSDSDAHDKSEIEHTKRMITGYNPVAIILDQEEWRYNSHAKKAAEAWINAFGDKAIIYAGQAYWRGPLKNLDCLRWIPAYGYNSGKPETKYKPDYVMEGWQYTSRGAMAGVKGNVDWSEWYGSQFDGVKVTAPATQERRPVYKIEVAVQVMLHLCTHHTHGYTMAMEDRQGTGTETIDIYGHKYTIAGGDRDCSSAVLNALRTAGIDCGTASYTGNMRKELVNSGNFVVEPMSYIAQSGDIYLEDDCHTAMCLSAEPDILMEFSGNEKGGAYGGKVGDQLQVGEYDSAYGRGESHLAKYYDYGKNGWSCILRCINKEVAFWIGDEAEEEKETSEAVDTAASKATAATEAQKSLQTATKAAMVILGDYGNGQERRNKLGSSYDDIQDVVTKVLQHHRDDLIRAMAEFIDSIGA